MTLRYKSLADITEADLRSLIERGVSEGREIEYKVNRPGKSDGEKKEFLHDVSSFANCIGGDLVFGVQEKKGVPIALPGLQLADIDAEKLRLESLVRDGIQPRIIPSVTIRPVALANSNVVVIARVSRSLASPHATTLGGSFRFYSRNSAGKYPLDMGEIRTAFIGSQQVIERLRRFRLDRIALIAGNEAPIELPDSAKFIVHIVPFAAFDAGDLYDVSDLAKKGSNLMPIGHSSSRIRYNFDGLLSFTNRDDHQHPGYVQVFRNGAIEAVETYMLRPEPDGRALLRGTAYENRLIEAIGRFLVLQRALGVGPPLAVMIALIGVKGYRISVSLEAFFAEPGAPIDRDYLLIPEVVAEEYNVDAGCILRPIFDAIWGAAGWPGSPNYDESGNRRSR